MADCILPQIEMGLCADIYTQLSDVEDEVNGLVTYDREVVKVDVDVMKEISFRIRQKVEELRHER